MRVSILLPVYNRAHTLERCLASIRAQTFTDWELIAVDDASTDGSAEVLEALGEIRLRILRHATNRGASAARNTALAAAKGEYVALIDSDDEWLPEKLEKQLAALAEADVDGCGCEYWTVDGGVEKPVSLPKPVSWADELEIRCELGNGSTLLAKRACLEAIGPMDEELRIYEDWDWMFRFAQRFTYTVVHEPLVRVHVSGKRDPLTFARSAERFLALHDAKFLRGGATHRARVRSLHYEYVAGNALAQRCFALGMRYTLKSVAAAPLRRPTLLGALPLAMLDAVLGTTLLTGAMRRFGAR